MIETPPEDLPATRASVVAIPNEADWVGGVSGIEVSPDGTGFHVITDRGHIARGTFLRDADTLRAVTFEHVRRLVPDDTADRELPPDDAEGLAVDSKGRLFVSFEHMHRVLLYDDWDADPVRPSYTRAWRALANNQGLEAIAISESGQLLTLPEQVNTGASEALLYTKYPDGRWQQTLTLPVQQSYKPVGADFGPDGRLYLLERSFVLLGFRSRVRVFSPGPDGFDAGETVMQTAWGDHGNLEGLAVWRDQNGHTRLTMVSDDNFLPFMRGQIVEYIIEDRVVQTDE